MKNIIRRDGLLGRRAVFSASPEELPFDMKRALADEFGVSDVDVRDGEYYITLLGDAEKDYEKELLNT